VNKEFAIFTGTANPALARLIASKLGAQVGACVVDRYPDGNVAVQLLETVRRKEVFLMQSTSPPVSDHLVELLALADACRRAGCARVTSVVPYFGHGRADKRNGRREPIMARVVADLMEIVGISHVITVDLHTPQIEGFFHAPVDSLTAVPTLCQALRDRLPANVVVVSPDVGRVGMATRYAQCLGAPAVVLHKRRVSGVETQVTHVVGEVSDRSCLIVDDMISTGGTMAESITALLNAGARPEIIVAATAIRAGRAQKAQPPRRARSAGNGHGMRTREGLAAAACHHNRAVNCQRHGKVNVRRVAWRTVLIVIA
jgi:ribose-phosphate pyrophosphokinase